MKVDKNQSIWYERYKPQCVDDVVYPKQYQINLRVMFLIRIFQLLDYSRVYLVQVRVH